MKTINELLTDQPLFADMSPDMVQFIAGCGRNEHYDTGAYLGKEGDPADHFYLIRKGRVAVELSHHIKGSIVIKTLEASDVAGFGWAFPPYRLNFDLRAIESTSVISFDAKCVLKKCEDDYKLGYHMIKKFAEIMKARLQDTRMQLINVYH
jgi:CRP-like cAMP-binding protein